MFEVPAAAGNVPPLLNLDIPHYDGIIIFLPKVLKIPLKFLKIGVQALVVSPDTVGVDGELFSGSRDTCIKR